MFSAGAPTINQSASVALSCHIAVEVPSCAESMPPANEGKTTYGPGLMKGPSKPLETGLQCAGAPQAAKITNAKRLRMVRLRCRAAGCGGRGACAKTARPYGRQSDG